jgi:pimeloyl-ACP methyl ester carboxylesterase
MTAVALIPGAGGVGWYWHLVERELQDRGYDAFAVDLAAGGRVGLPAYADAVVDAIGRRTDVAVVAQSMGAFTAPLVCQRIAARSMTFVNAMIPAPGETPGEWWDNVGSERARIAAASRGGYATGFDLATYFVHDLPDDLIAELNRHASSQLDERFSDVCSFDAWPPIPLHAVAGRDDRFLPLELQQRVAHERLGVDPVVVPEGHLAALSYPREMASAIAGLLSQDDGRDAPAGRRCTSSNGPGARIPSGDALTKPKRL